MWNYYIDSLVLLIKTEEVYGLPTITVESSSWSLSSFWRSLQWDPLPEHQAAVSACLSLTYFPIRVWEPPAFTLSLQGFICHTVKSYHYAFLGLETDYQAVSLVSMHVLSFFLILECVFGGVGGDGGGSLAFIVGYLCLLISQSPSLVHLYWSVPQMYIFF